MRSKIALPFDSCFLFLVSINHPNSSEMNTQQLEARRIDHNTYDIFIGKQWSTWVRVRQGKNNTYRLAGEKVDHAFLKDLDKILAPNMPITYGQDMHTMLRNNLAIQ